MVCNYADAGNVVGGEEGNEFFRENVGRQVEGSPEMGVAALLESEASGLSRGKGELGEALLAVVKLRTRAVEVAKHVREEVSGMWAALAVKLF